MNNKNSSDLEGSFWINILSEIYLESEKIFNSWTI